MNYNSDEYQELLRDKRAKRAGAKQQEVVEDQVAPAQGQEDSSFSSHSASSQSQPVSSTVSRVLWPAIKDNGASG